jgi:superfamily I DNA/RNA helicase
MNFTPSQLAAVDLTKIRQDTCVVAGPGSGKTAVLVECYRRLVVEARVPPTRLLAITFTERAARSMKQKLAKEFAG